MATTLRKLKSTDYFDNNNEYFARASTPVRDYILPWNDQFDRKLPESTKKYSFTIGKLHSQGLDFFINKPARLIQDATTSLIFGSNLEEKISFSILGKTFTIDSDFSDLLEEINNSKEILDYKDNWDYDGAIKVNQNNYISAINYVIDYSNFLHDRFNLKIDTPEINAGRNSNVYLTWRTKNARLAISFETDENSEILAHYYGDLRSKGQPIKGNINVKEFSEYLAYWMKNLI